MAEEDSSGLTIVGGRPGDGAGDHVELPISSGLRGLLHRLAENPELARDLVDHPEETLAAEELTLSAVEVAMLRDLDGEDLLQTRGLTRAAPTQAERDARREGLGQQLARWLHRPRSPAESNQEAGEGLARGKASQSDWEDRKRRLAAQLELVAPFVGDPDFYMGERTRGIRPQSIYPTPYAVAEALIRRDSGFREAFLADPEQAVLRSLDLPLATDERSALLYEPVLRRLEHTARDV